MWTFDSDTDPGHWVPVETPTNVTLRDLTTTANGPLAVGDKGVAIGRGADRWGVVLEDGPGARSRTLYAVDTTDDGERVWFAGAGGALGYYDLRTEQRRDHSVPRGNANAFYSLTVAGERGSEKLLVGDGSGTVLPARVENGNDVIWDWSTSPNNGNAMEAIAHDDAGYGYAVDVASKVHMTTENDGWETVGIERAQGSFYDCAVGGGRLLIGGGNGRVFEATGLRGNEDPAWTPSDLGGFTIYGLDAARGGQLACGEGGNVFLRSADGEWARGTYDGTETFRAGLIGEQMVVVGSNGLVVERGEREAVAENVDSDADDGSGGNAGQQVGDGDGDESVEWVTHDVPDGSEGGDGSGSDGGDDGSGGSDGPGTDSGSTGDDTDGWASEPTGSADGDNFDGRGENFDGDESHSDSLANQNASRSGDTDDTMASDDPENAPASDDSGSDEADPPDEPDGDDSGNDEADPADEDTDSSDES